jgi:short-subunit dehydrogenase
MNILVTGASRGIGKEIALSLKALGNVFVTARSEKELKELDCAGYFVCDLAKDEDLAALGNFIIENKIDVLVNNAGEYIYSKVDETIKSDLEHIIKVN